jgi:YVTN family beta-propeller protein
MMPTVRCALAGQDDSSGNRYANQSARVYIGAATCGQCHHDNSGRNQFNRWYRTAHASAYATLPLAVSEQIAKLSGIEEDAWHSPVCLGCHATASDSESWEQDHTFYPQDGIQCEFCHGPGSEYADADIMGDRTKALNAGLRLPGADFCRRCHLEKGSHTAVIKVAPFDVDKALQTIAHQGRGGPLEITLPDDSSTDDHRRYAGVMACAQCHQGPQAGFAFSKWRLSAHAEAYVVLDTDAARGIARQAGISGHPQAADECLRCHSTAFAQPPSQREEHFTPMRGVQCESCHGAGSRHITDAQALETDTAVLRSLDPVNAETCRRCHNGYHGKSFEFGTMSAQIAHPRPEPNNSSKTTAAGYKTPFNLAISADGQTLYIACEASGSLIVADTRQRRKIAEVKVGKLPHGVSLSPDQTKVYVSNRGSDSITVIDAVDLKPSATLAVGDEPHGLATDKAGRYLYVANAGSHDISVVDLMRASEIKRLAGGRGSWAMRRSPDGRFIYVTNNLSHFVPFRSPSLSEVSIIDTATAQIADRIMLPQANLVQGIDFAPDGSFALVTLLRTKNLVPIVRVIQGWVITNGIGLLWPDGRVDQLLLDEFDDYFADPTDVAITPDGRYAYISGGGVNEVAVVDLNRLQEVLANAGDHQRRHVIPNHIGIPSTYVVARIGVGHGPRGLLVDPAGRFVYVADALSDTISIIDVATRRKVDTIDLGGPIALSAERLGERVFHSAEVTYGRQFSCHSCHPDGGIDGLTYDIEPDGLGLNPVDNRTLRGILDTAPFKWTGKNPSLNRQCGPRLAVFFTRIDPFNADQVSALERYICTIPRNPNRYLTAGRLTPAQRRGKLLYERSYTNSGKAIAPQDRCVSCHPGPYFTNRQKADVGTQSALDTQGTFDVPHLNNIYETAPYLHDGQAASLEEIWTRFNPDDRHGVTNDMTKDQLNDLIEYLKIL